jgi:hypothetical protein
LQLKHFCASCIKIVIISDQYKYIKKIKKGFCWIGKDSFDIILEQVSIVSIAQHHLHLFIRVRSSQVNACDFCSQLILPPSWQEK